MKKSLIIASALVAATIAGAADRSTTPAQRKFIVGPGKIHRVIDGDTFILHSERIRLWGVDAPEQHTKAGRAATVYLAAYTNGKTVICLDTRQRSFERVVARCFLYQDRSWIDLARLMVKRGHATDVPRYSGGLYK